MPAKKTKKTQSQTSQNKSDVKKPSAKKTNLAAKANVKKTVKTEQPTNSANAKKIVSKKSDQLLKQKPVKKLKSKKILWPIIILLLGLGLWFFRDQFIVAMVNGKPITRFKVIRELEKQGANQIVESLVTMELVNQAIKDSGVEVDDEAIADQLAEIEESLTAQGQNLDDLLAMQNLTRADIEKDIRLNLQVDKILADKIQVSDEEIMEYFETNQEFLGEDVDFAEMKEEIRAQVIQEKRAQAQQEWLETLRSEANIRYLRFEPSLF